MYDRFTDRARKVMALARKEAHRFKHDFIGTEHILLGLIEERSGVAAHVLRGLGVEINRVRSEIEKNVPFGPSEVTRGQLPFTPRAKKVLELSMKEADELRHNYLGTEHLLLGLLRENGGVGALVLRDLGLELEEVRYGVLEVLGAGSGGATKPASLWGTNAAVVALAGEEALRAGQASWAPVTSSWRSWQMSVGMSVRRRSGPGFPLPPVRNWRSTTPTSRRSRSSGSGSWPRS